MSFLNQTQTAEDIKGGTEEDEEEEEEEEEEIIEVVDANEDKKENLNSQENRERKEMLMEFLGNSRRRAENRGQKEREGKTVTTTKAKNESIKKEEVFEKEEIVKRETIFQRYLQYQEDMRRREESGQLEISKVEQEQDQRMSELFGQQKRKVQEFLDRARLRSAADLKEERDNSNKRGSKVVELNFDNFKNDCVDNGIVKGLEKEAWK